MTEGTLEKPQEKVFTVSDSVSWRSSANGVTKKKTGVVAVVVPAGSEPMLLIPEGFRCDVQGGPRDHESYLVQVGESKELYWPRVSKLSPVKPKKEPKVKAPRKEPLQVGKTSIIVDGKEIIFNKNQKELPGMPEITRLHKLADGFVVQSEEIEEEQLRLQKIRSEMMSELKNEGRAEFGFRKGGVTYRFAIVQTDEKIKVEKKN